MGRGDRTDKNREATDEKTRAELAAETRDLVAAARAGDLKAAHFREIEIAATLDHLDKGHSVLLLGPVGVGKTTVIHGVASAMADRSHGLLFETSTVGLLSGTRYLGEWQTKVMRLAGRLAGLKAALVVTDLASLATAGATVQSDQTLFNALKPDIESGRVVLLAEATPELLRALQRIPGFVRLFHAIDVAPLVEDKVLLALARAAERRGVAIDPASQRALVKVTSRFLAARPQPGPATTLLEQVLDYAEQKRGIGEHEPISPAFVEKVFAITSGLPPFVVSRSVTMPASEIQAKLAERIVGQRSAIDVVVETIALFKAGLNDPSRPLGSFLFVGPTGVGKTEVARALAELLFGSEHRLLRFDLSEFKDYASFAMLLGDQRDPEKPARLLDPVRAVPFQVVLFDELEKAHPNVWDLLLPLLDEGRATAPNGDTVDFRNTVVIATSNIGAQDAGKSLGFGAAGADDGSLRAARIRSALEAALRPELLNRFQHVVVFHPLSPEQLRTVARQEIARVLRREGIAGRGLVLDVDDGALDAVIAQGTDPRYGARALKREVQRRIVLPLAMTLMERDVVPESILKVSAKDGEIRIRVVETEASRAHRDEQRPARDADGRALTSADLGAKLEISVERLDALGRDLDLPRLSAERERLLLLRNAPDFWTGGASAERIHRELRAIEAAMARLTLLRDRANEVRKALPDARGRAALEKLGARARSLDQAIDEARRELVLLGTEGSADAIVEIRPIGGTGRGARDLLVTAYTGWAAHRRMVLDWLFEPREDDEPALVGVKGRYAFGMLRGEAGLHRVRLESREGEAGRVAVVSIRVAAWGEDRTAPRTTSERPLKATGQYGGKIRSRLELESGLVLQSGRTLAENREKAAEVAASWARAPAAREEIVRRYDRMPPLVRDTRSGFSSGRPDALSPELFDTLLRASVDAQSS